MTLSEAEKKLNELFAIHGKDYVVHAGNHADILRAINDNIIAEMEAERAEITGERRDGA